MIYRDEFTRLKEIYNRMPEARRLMIGPMLGLPLMVMALYGLVLLPFGNGGFGMEMLIGSLGMVLSALMISATMGIAPQIAAWRAAAAPPAAEEKPALDPVALHMLSIANDPGQSAEAAADDDTADAPIQWQNL